MKFFLLAVILFVSPHAFAQRGYSITYNSHAPRRSVKITGGEVYLPNDKWRFVYNDTASFSYLILAGKDPLKKSKKSFGEEMQPFGTYSFKNSKIIYHTVQDTNRNAFVFQTSYIKHDWISLANTKKIMGYNCKASLSVNENNDSVLVYYTDELNTKFTPFVSADEIRGVILEIFNQKNGIHFLANKIISGEFKISLPRNVSIISKEERIRRTKTNSAKDNYLSIISFLQ